MTTVFPTSNLPTASQPWGREMQKQLTNLIASTNSERINNTARDNQLNSSIVALTGVVADVQVAAQEANDAINGLVSLSSSGSEYTLNADNITAGTINASLVTVTNIDATNITAGRIVGGSTSATLDFVSSNGASYFQVWDNNARMRGGSATIQCYDSTILLAGNVFATDSISASSVSGGAGTFNTSLQSSNIPGNGLGGGAVDVYASSSLGRLGVQSSSRNTKQDINTINLNVESILSIEPKTFKYNVDVEEFGLENAPTVIGFIAEDLDDAGLEYFVHYGQDGLPQSIPYSKYVVALQAVVRNLNDRITALENGA